MRFSLISRQDLKIGTGSFEIQLADGKLVVVDEIDIGALAELTPIKTYATTADLPTLAAGALARVATNGHLYMTDGTTWAEIAGTHTHVFSEVTSGIVPVAQGGTGATFATTAQGALWYFSGTGAIAALAAGTRGAFLEAKGAAANPIWLGPLTNGQMFIGSTGVDAVAAIITGSNGITVTGGAGTLALSGGRKIVRKGSSETINNTAALQDDDTLTFTIGANEIWCVDYSIFASNGASNAADIQFAISVPAGATGGWGVIGPGVGATSVSAAAVVTFVHLDAFGDANPLRVDLVNGLSSFIKISANIQNGGTAGSVTLRWAQFSAVAVDTTVGGNSFLIAVLG